MAVHGAKATNCFFNISSIVQGVHGAGLMHLLWLRDRELVLEIEKAWRGDHYRQLAAVTNKHFVRLEIGGTSDLDEKAKQLLVSALDSHYTTSGFARLPLG